MRVSFPNSDQSQESCFPWETSLCWQKKQHPALLTCEGFTTSCIVHPEFHITIKFILINCSCTTLWPSLYDVIRSPTSAKPWLEGQWLCIFLQDAGKLLAVGKAVNSLPE